MATELAEGIWHLDLGGVNAYLIDDGGDLVLSDAGMPWHDDDIEAELAEAGFEVSEVDRILLTHYDIDHVGALSKLPFRAPVYAGAADAALLRGERKPPLSNHKGVLQRVMGVVISRPSLEVRTVEDGETVGSFTAYHTPGHTPGHTVFVSEERSVALLGDLVVSKGGELEPSSWALSYDTGRVGESIRSLVERTPAFEVACPGHGRPLREGGYDALAALA